MRAGQTDSRGKAPSIDKAFSPMHSIDRPSAVGPRNKRWYHLRHLPLLIGFALMIGVGGAFVYNLFSNSTETSTSNQVKSVFSDEDMHEFTSPESEYSIMMPGFPKIEKRTEEEQGKKVPVSLYSRTLNNGAKTYSVEVFDYSAVGDKKELDAAVNEALRNKSGTTINGVSKSPFQNYPSAFVEYATTREAGSSEQTYSRFIQKDERIYIIRLSGASKVEFDEFAGSLKLS